MSQLSVLYAADNNYAPFLGVSLFSLLENNKKIDQITIYVVLDKVTNENQQKLQKLVDQYQRKLFIIDATEFNKKIESLNIPKYRGSYTTNYRLFFDSIIQKNTDKLMYLDSDTIITGDLSSLLEINMKDKCAAVVMDSLSGKYKHLIGFSSEAPYFNAGVMFIDVNNWHKNRCSEILLDYIKNQRSKFCNPDQDLLNIILKDKIFILPPEYNFMPFHRAYSNKVYGKVYGFDNYYSEKEIDNAKKYPIILHTYRFLGQFPWHKNNIHPDTKVFDIYLRKSPWNKYEKKYTTSNNVFFKIEKILYIILPNFCFLHLFNYLSSIRFKVKNRKLQNE